MNTSQSIRKSTLIGGSAVLMWGLLAILTTQTGNVPPFLLIALAFGIASTVVMLKWLIQRESIFHHLAQPVGAWLVGVTGLFGYHFFYFMALKNAPPIEASLIAYMWPLLIVLFSTLLTRERLRWFHLIGALAGLAGVALLMTDGQEIGVFKKEFALGYVMAICCAITWSSYSVINSRFSDVPIDAVGGYCAVTTLLAIFCHLKFETTVWPPHLGAWLATFGLGLLPLGLAFFAWDHGTKHGDIRILGVFAHAAPLISTILLIVFGKGVATPAILIGAMLIIGGAMLAAKEMFFLKH